jgi:hypothetical protein
MITAFAIGCSEPEPLTKPESPKDRFLRIVSLGDGLTFIDSSGVGARIGGVSCELKFLENSRVELVGYGYSISFAEGSYTFVTPETIAISLDWDDPDWPQMTLSSEGGELLLKREDGETLGYPRWIFWEDSLPGFYPLRASIQPKTEHDGGLEGLRP